VTACSWFRSTTRPEWYRYHHLFQDVLRHHLLETQADLVSVLHVRASTWFAQHGLRDEAIEHAVSAGAWETAAELIEAWMEPLGMRGEYTTLFRWLSAVPEALRERHPLLSYQYGLALVRRARAEDAEEAQRALHAAERHAVQSGDTALLGAVERARLSLAIQRSELDQAIEYGRRAIDAIPSGERRLRVEALATLSRAWTLRGDPNTARPLVREAEDLVDQDTDIEVRRLVLNAAAHCSLAAGELHRALAAASEARHGLGLTHSLEGAHARIRWRSRPRVCSDRRSAC
jgi:LuxR family maltose regulon positive regulatory protein